jgi:hypothetical protein
MDRGKVRCRSQSSPITPIAAGVPARFRRAIDAYVQYKTFHSGLEGTNVGCITLLGGPAGRPQNPNAGRVVRAQSMSRGCARTHSPRSHAQVSIAKSAR